VTRESLKFSTMLLAKLALPTFEVLTKQQMTQVVIKREIKTLSKQCLLKKK
jgi:hypothetical protein